MVDIKRSNDKLLTEIYSFQYVHNNLFYYINPSEVIKLKQVTTEPEFARRLVKLFKLLPENLTFKEKLKSLKYNFDFFKSNNIADILNKDNLFSKINFAPFETTHIEAPFQQDILNKAGSRISTVNFYFCYEKNGTLGLRINNLQGFKGKNSELNNFNWRLVIVNRLKEFAESRNIQVIGEFPKYFSKLTLEKDYHRQIENYLLTYLKAGMKPENIDLRFINHNEFRNQYKTSLELIKSKSHQQIKKIIRIIESQRYKDLLPKKEMIPKNQLEIKFPKLNIKPKIK